MSSTCFPTLQQYVKALLFASVLVLIAVFSLSPGLVGTALPSTVLKTSAPTALVAGPRYVYLDMGANWANTLRLYADLAPNGKGGVPVGAEWEVYAFEANPFIQAYLDLFIQYLNGQGKLPALRVPPAGSTQHLSIYAKKFGCQATDAQAMRSCMNRLFAAQILALPTAPALNDTRLIEARMAEAVVSLAQRRSRQQRFTLIPAAVGAENGWLDIPEKQARSNLIRGGTVLSGIHGQQGGNPFSGERGKTFRVTIVDVVSWMISSFHERDYVVVKMDVEGAEHGILRELIRRHKLGVIDILAYECHGGKKCVGLNAEVAAEAKTSGVSLLHEGKDYHGWDRYSTPELYYPLDPRKPEVDQLAR